MTPGKDIFIIGGPNGAGKTTAARVLIPGRLAGIDFLNADEIAREIRPENPEAAALAAGRELILRMRELIRKGKSIALETTCAGSSHVATIKDCRQHGWNISFFYFWLPSPEHSIARVANRVAQGGHHIPDEVIYRRFRKGLWNMRNLYLPLADEAEIYDNSVSPSILIAEKRKGQFLQIRHGELWREMEEKSQ